MRSPNKNRSRNKSNRNKSVGNVVNRVFESAGPDGKVRGTPQQVIEKYQTLARDATLAGDPVAAENFLQHAEHYVRLLAEANAQIEAQQQQRQEREQAQRAAQSEDDAAKAPEGEAEDAPQSNDAAEAANGAESTLVDTPEQAEPFARARRRSRRTNGAAKSSGDAHETEPQQQQAEVAPETPAVEAEPEQQPAENG